MSFPENKEEMRRSRGMLEQAVRDAGCTLIKGNAARCPWHEDKHPSGSISQDPATGIWRFACFKCDISEDIFGVQKRSGQRMEGSTRKDAPKKPVKIHATINDVLASYRHGYQAHYAYANPDTRKVELLIIRAVDSEGKKQFIQYRPEGTGFTSGAPPKPWPIFNRTRVRESAEVWIVEGEKCVMALHAAGVVATTSPCGAGKAAHSDWSMLAGKKCYLWPDNDPVDAKTGKRAGIDHMKDVVNELSKLEPKPIIMWIDPEELGLGPKEDVADFLEPYEGDAIESGRALDAVRSIATTTGPAEELEKLFEDIISGKRKAIPWMSRGLTNLTRALLPGMVTCICGDPGCGKSFKVLEDAAYWHMNGTSVAIFELEDDLAYHLNRAIAQIEDRSEFTNDTWVAENPDEVRAAMERRRHFVSSFGACIDTCPNEGDISLDDLLEWVRKQCIAKKRIIIVDPVTVADSGAKPWVADRKFILVAKALVRASGSSLLLVTHPKMGSKPGVSPLHGMAGGAAYPRFAHTVLWMTRHDKQKNVLVSGSFGQFRTSINRSIRIGKARNGVGSGMELGFFFDPKSLRFVEQGAVVTESDEVESPPVESDLPI